MKNERKVKGAVEATEKKVMEEGEQERGESSGLSKTRE